MSPAPVNVAEHYGYGYEITGHTVHLNECANVGGATTWWQQGYYSRSGSPVFVERDVALVETFTFPSAAAASAAYTGVLAGMNQCQPTSRALQTANHIPADAVCTATSQTANAAAFERTWTSVPGFSAGGPEVNHLYVAVRGATILVLHFEQRDTNSGSAAIYSVRNDPAVLTMLTGVLAVQNRVISSAERGALTAAFVADKGISATDVLGGGPVRGSVYYAYDPATITYWALATFQPSSTASLNVKVSFQDGEGTGMFRKTGTSPWQVQTSVWPPICGELRFFPAAVLRVWALPTTPPAGPTC